MRQAATTFPSVDELDGLVRATLDELRPRAEVKAQGAASLAILAAAEPNRPARPSRPGGRFRAVIAVSVAAAAAVLALTLAGSARPASRPAGQASLAAFTVSRQPGTVDVTIRDLLGASSASARAALQRELRADGVPADIGSWGPARCGKSPLWGRVFTVLIQHGGQWDPRLRGVVYEIHPSAIPHGARVDLPVWVGRGGLGRPLTPAGEASRRGEVGGNHGGNHDTGLAFGVGGIVILHGGHCLDGR